MNNRFAMRIAFRLLAKRLSGPARCCLDLSLLKVIDARSRDALCHKKSVVSNLDIGLNDRRRDIDLD
jgi:hypothetical protein